MPNKENLFEVPQTERSKGVLIVRYRIIDLSDLRALTEDLFDQDEGRLEGRSIFLQGGEELSAVILGSGKDEIQLKPIDSVYPSSLAACAVLPDLIWKEKEAVGIVCPKFRSPNETVFALATPYFGNIFKVYRANCLETLTAQAGRIYTLEIR